MANNGRYEKVPRPESIKYLLDFLNQKDFVQSVEKVLPQIYDIRREDKPTLRVFLTNIYIVSISDVFDILGYDDEIDAIITMSAWNSYTDEAKQHCREKGVGLFKMKEFMGAVYYGGKRFVDYVPKERY